MATTAIGNVRQICRAAIVSALICGILNITPCLTCKSYKTGGSDKVDDGPKSDTASVQPVDSGSKMPKVTLETGNEIRTTPKTNHVDSQTEDQPIPNSSGDNSDTSTGLTSSSVTWTSPGAGEDHALVVSSPTAAVVVSVSLGIVVLTISLIVVGFYCGCGKQRSNNSGSTAQRQVSAEAKKPHSNNDKATYVSNSNGTAEYQIDDKRPEGYPEPTYSNSPVVADACRYTKSGDIVQFQKSGGTPGGGTNSTDLGGAHELTKQEVTYAALDLSSPDANCVVLHPDAKEAVTYSDVKTTLKR